MLQQLQAAGKNSMHEVIEVKLWGSYLSYCRADLYRTLADASINTSDPEETEPGRISFVFTPDTWEDRIKHVLYENRIPVIVRSSRRYQ